LRLGAGLEWRLRTLQRHLDEDVAVGRDLDVGHLADRDATDLDRVALDELSRVLELRRDLVGAAGQQEIAHHEDRDDDRANGGDSTYPAYRSHLMLWLSSSPRQPPPYEMGLHPPARLQEGVCVMRR
jgi:hypothetical protein